MATTISSYEVEQNREDLEAFVGGQEELSADQEQAVEIITEFQGQLERNSFEDVQNLYEALLQVYADFYELSVNDLRGGYYSDDLEDKHGGDDFYELITWNLCTMEQVLDGAYVVES